MFRPVVPLRWVLVRDPAGRFRPQALLCTDQALAPVSIIETYLQRWQVEVTFEEARRHLGVETQRQWSDRAIARATPILLALFTLVTLCAGALARGGTLPPAPAAWYRKAAPTFGDALGAVRREVWLSILSTALHTSDARQSHRYLFRRFIEPLLDAA